jgi:hypothetical protein
VTTQDLLTDMPVLGIDNPYWDAVKDFVRSQHPALGPGLTIGGGLDEVVRMRREGKRVSLGEMFFGDVFVLREQLVRRYAYTVTDPATLRFVADWASRGRLIDPLAGTGYWAATLEALGLDVLASDHKPPSPQDDGDDANFWHGGQTTFTRVQRCDGVEAVRTAGSNRTLLLSWPPMDATGYEILTHYDGDRVIHIGELGGCTGDDNLVAELVTHWHPIAKHRPVQWSGIRDQVLVLERGPMALGDDNNEE